MSGSISQMTMRSTLGVQHERSRGHAGAEPDDEHGARVRVHQRRHVAEQTLQPHVVHLARRLDLAAHVEVPDAAFLLRHGDRRVQPFTRIEIVHRPATLARQSGARTAIRAGGTGPTRRGRQDARSGSRPRPPRGAGRPKAAWCRSGAFHSSIAQCRHRGRRDEPALCVLGPCTGDQEEAEQQMRRRWRRRCWPRRRRLPRGRDPDRAPATAARASGKLAPQNNAAGRIASAARTRSI